MENIWYPFTQMKTATAPIEIVRGHGAYLTSADGVDYLDAIASWWVNLHGHSHPYIAEKVGKQAEILEHSLFAGFSHPTALELASRLLPLLPGGMSKLFYSDNGSTAVEVALKIAIQYWSNRGSPRKMIVSFKGGYHGDTFGAMSAAGKTLFNQPFWDHLFEVISITPPTPGQEEQSVEELTKALKSDQVACFIFEPLIQGAGGMITHCAKTLDYLLALCREQQVLTIADEVMTGFGRTGSLFACDQLRKKPDMICLAKGMTGGFLPLGATACTEEIYQAFHVEEQHKAFLHGHSYMGNPIACATALASLDLLHSSFIISQRQMIAQEHAAFVAKWKGHPQLKRCESLGAILVLEYQVEEPSYFSKVRDTLYAFFLSHHIILRPLGPVVYLIPPYCVTRKELAYIYETISLTLEHDLCKSDSLPFLLPL